MPGLQFEKRRQFETMSVRGLSSFDYDLIEPLIIVDNFPYHGDINSLNPSEIESITLLRDAAATSIWGARAGNGVIVITRKKPVTGQTTLSYQANVNQIGKPRIMELPLMSTEEFIDVEELLFEKGFYNNLFDPKINRTSIVSPYVLKLNEYRKGAISATELTEFRNQIKDLDYRKEILRYSYRPESFYQQYFSINHNLKNIGLRSAVGYDKVYEGLKKDQNSRLNISQVISLNIKDKLKMDVRADFSFSNRKIGKEQAVYPFNMGGRRPFSYPYLSFFDKEGVATRVPYQYPTDFINSLNDAGILDWTFTPFSNQNGWENITKTTNQNIDFQIAYKLKEWLSLEALYSLGNQYSRVDELFHEESFYVRNLVNRFTQRTDKGYVYGIPEGHIKDLRFADQIAHRARALLRLDKTWRVDYSLNVLLGSEISSLKNTSNSMRFYGFNDRNFSIRPMNFNDLMPTYLGLFPQQRPFLGAGMNERNNRFVSFFANAAYIFRSKYVITGSARKDASNVFGVKTNRRWNPLWSVGGMWRMDKENWLQTFPFIHKLNLKSTFGHSGNAGGSSTSLPILSLQAPLSYDLYPLQQAIIQQLPNPYLKWENVAMYNVGLELGLLKGKINASLDYFIKNSSDLLARDVIDWTLGFNQMERNIGELNGKGFDLQLNTNLDGREFTWNFDLNLSKSTNTVKTYRGSWNRASAYVSSINSTMNPIEGKTLYPVFSYKFAGLNPENGNPQGYYKGNISENYLAMMGDSIQNTRFFGTSMAPYFGSMRNSIQWRKINFTFNLAYKFGAFKQKETIIYQNLFNQWKTHADFSKRWQKPGDENNTNIPSLIYPANTNRDLFFAHSEVNIYNASHIRLSDLRINYSVRLGGGMKKSILNLFILGSNIGILWAKNNEGIDPENYPLPLPRTYSCGFNWKL